MKIIILGEELDHSHSFEFDPKWLYGIALFAFCLILALVISTLVAVERSGRIQITLKELDGLQEHMLFEQNKLNEFYTYADSVFTEHAIQAGNLQARLARVEALGSRLAHMADFDADFDFYSRPAIGGPDESLHEGEESNPQTNVLQALDQLSRVVNERENQLKALESLLMDRQLGEEQFLAGRPVSAGWLSSSFGKRIDPFHGHMAWHNGVDFAGAPGAEILSVASGVVVWSGEQYGYGQMVEIDHGNGLSTRYAHNRDNEVALGDVVSKGQIIARMGSSGRSTGYHVHFEVLKNGHPVDPVTYIYRETL